MNKIGPSSQVPEYGFKSEDPEQKGSRGQKGPNKQLRSQEVLNKED